jgi:ATP-dependent Lhr-like helicase
VQKFSVRDASSNSFISTLDEDFVALIDQNDLFITKGVPWRVLDIDRENRTMVVEQSEDISAAIPDWEGEEIPTSFEVAQRVGRLRREIKEGKVPDVEGIEEVSAEIKKFDTSELPDDKNIFIEACADTAVMHIAGGLKANRTLAALIAFYLAEDVGASVRTLVDPYRIVFILPHAADAAKFKGHIARLAHSDIKFELESILPSNPIFKYKFLHAAQAFSFEPRKVTDRLIAALMDTPIFAETMREVLAEYFDASNAKLIIDGISSKEIGLHCRDVKELSALAMRALLRYHGGELIAPIEPTSEIVKAFKRRLLAREVNLLCTYCKHNWQSILGDLPEKIKCGSCGSPMVTVCRREELKLFKKKKRLTSQEMGQRSRLERAAGAIAAGGKRAAIALSAYGVGPSTAAHILSRHYKEEDEFFVALLEAQKNFIKTRRYWEAH